MTGGEAIRCRVGACREALADEESWSFYLLNDGDAPLDSAVLYRVSSEWGNQSHSEDADVRVENLGPGAHALIWRDDGEFRTELSLHVRAGDRGVRLSFEFPKLYVQTRLGPIRGLGKLGCEVTAEA
jgi:hypothetical protein